MANLPKNVTPVLENLPNFTSPANWGIKDGARFSELMNELITLVEPGFYFGDNLFVWGRNNSLLDDSAFIESWSENKKNNADVMVIWRRYILATAAYHCVQLEGDFVECGVYWGTGIKTIADYLGGKEFDKTFWGYDAFDYHPSEAHGSFDDQQTGFYEKVQQRFQRYPTIKLIKGLIPDVFVKHCPEKIAYLHIDLNSAEYEIATLEALFDLIVPGGMIILDDYEWAAYRKQKLAEDAWFDQRQYKVMPLPTGQGLIFKR